MYCSHTFRLKNPNVFKGKNVGHLLVFYTLFMHKKQLHVRQQNSRVIGAISVSQTFLGPPEEVTVRAPPPSIQGELVIGPMVGSITCGALIH